ncbi:MAG: transposase [Ferrovum sp.]|nr:transposase [Ferrovum sp.]NDU87954.1 transposase [Ferrovum sp.]
MVLRNGAVLWKIEVPPFYSSQECTACGHVHQDKRVSQAEFVCLSCGNTDHADHNAAKVIAMRGVRQLLSGKRVQKEKKRCRITRYVGLRKSSYTLNI